MKIGVPNFNKVPNMRKMQVAVREQEADKVYTICCKSCKKPLWEITNIKEYGSKFSADKKAYPGVPEYNDIWSKNGEECSQINCPFCDEQWMTAVTTNGKVFCQPYVRELQGV